MIGCFGKTKTRLRNTVVQSYGGMDVLEMTDLMSSGKSSMRLSDANIRRRVESGLEGFMFSAGNCYNDALR